MTKNVVHFDKEFGVTRVDLLEAMSMNRQLIQESNEKLFDRMDVEVRALRDEIRRVETKFDKLMYGIVVAILVPIFLHFMFK